MAIILLGAWVIAFLLLVTEFKLITIVALLERINMLVLVTRYLLLVEGDRSGIVAFLVIATIEAVLALVRLTRI